MINTTTAATLHGNRAEPAFAASSAHPAAHTPQSLSHQIRPSLLLLLSLWAGTLLLPGSLSAQVFGASTAPSAAPVESAPPRAPASIVPANGNVSSANPNAAPATTASTNKARRTTHATGKSTLRRTAQRHTSGTAKHASTSGVAQARVISIPRESAPPSAPASDETPTQKAADQQLLQQQRAQSAQDAQQNNQVIQAAEQRRAAQQSQIRVQDAPGPAQTGVVPAAGPPVVPANNSRDIQDAPGPAQTMPTPATPATPTQPTQPTTPPQ